MNLEAYRCVNGHLMYPDHPRCRECGKAIAESIDLSGREGEIVTWTVSYATPPGVREPNPLAFVRFEVDGAAVVALGGLTSEDVTSGQRVEPVAVDELRDPDVAIRHVDSQTWDGYRFRPIE